MLDKMQVTTEIKGNTGIITLDYPPQNLLTEPDFMDISQLLRLAENPQVNGIIIKGAGRHFSGGADLNQLFKLAENKELLMEKMQSGNRLLQTIENLELPVIAEINGACFGGGLEIALACHIRICSQNSLFAFPEVNHNLIPGLGGATRLKRITGESTALTILLSGDILGSEEALKYRIVDYVVPKEELPNSTMQYMEKLIGRKIKKVVQSVMRAWHCSHRMTYDEALNYETSLFCDLALDELKRRRKT